MAGRWTPTDDDRLAELLEAHLPYAAIARRLGRTVGAVERRCDRIGMHLGDANGRSVQDVARLLGVEHKTVAGWCRRDWLRSHAIGTVPRGRRNVRVVEHEDLVRFLEDDRYWQLWQPERISDSALREWAMELRAGVRFLGVSEAAALLHVSIGYVNKLIRQGRIPAAKRGANWRIRADRLRLPDYRPWRRGRSATAEEDGFIRRWWGKRTAIWIGSRLGLSDVCVGRRARLLGLAPLGRGSWARRRSRERKAG